MTVAGDSSTRCLATRPPAFRKSQGVCGMRRKRRIAVLRGIEGQKRRRGKREGHTWRRARITSFRIVAKRHSLFCSARRVRRQLLHIVGDLVHGSMPQRDKKIDRRGFRATPGTRAIGSARFFPKPQRTAQFTVSLQIACQSCRDARLSGRAPEEAPPIFKATARSFS